MTTLRNCTSMNYKRSLKILQYLEERDPPTVKGNLINLAIRLLKSEKNLSFE